MRFGYHDNAEIVVQGIEGLAGRARNVDSVLEQVGERMTQYSIPENFRVGGRPLPWKPSQRALESTRGGQTMVDTGRLRRSMNFEMTHGKLTVGTNLEYAAQRQFGGEIKAKGKALAIPVNVSRSKYRPSQYGDSLKWAPDATPGPGKRGLLVEYLSRGKGKKKRMVVRFVLRDSITQPARPFLLFQADDIAFAEKAVVTWLLGSPS